MRTTLFFAVLSIASSAWAGSLAGRWDGTIQYDDLRVPFRVEFSENGGRIQASFFNGDERITSTSGHLEGNTLVVNFDHYASKIEATLSDGVLKGTYGSKRLGIHDFEARPHRSAEASSGPVPEISGVWDLPNESPKGEHAWRFVVQQKGPEVSAAILRVDGDTGALTGRFQDGKLLLSHFDGLRVSLLEVEPRPDGTLNLTLKGTHGSVKKFVATRITEARAKGLPEPTDPDQHTTVKNPQEPFRFSFPDVNGNVVANTDARFHNKVVIVNITGSWCPNCHDEAPFLEALYRKYRDQGLEIVALDFEEAEQLQDKTRLRAFIQKYGIEYTYLVAGETKELQAKIPQAVNLNSWPTTFFLGRDGRVRAVHAGFAAAASGEFHRQLEREVAATVEGLLAEGTEAAK